MEEFKKQLKTLTGKLKEAEARAEYAEKTVKKLQKEVDRLEGKDFVKAISIKLYIFEQNYLQTKGERTNSKTNYIEYKIIKYLNQFRYK